MSFPLSLLLSYLSGSIPTAYLAGKLFKGIDLREHGSGNLGATNVYRVMGAKIAALVLLVDMAKGAVPVLVLPGHTRATPHLTPVLMAVAYGVAAILGHVRSVFLLFRGGGKGVATAAGVFLALTPVAALIALAVWLVVLYVWGYVSLASLSAAVTLPLVVAFWDGVRSAVLVACLLVAVFVFWTHRANIARLRRGEEPRFGRKQGPT